MLIMTYYRERLGQASINQESAVLYASWNKPHFYMNVALWSGIFQTSHKRRSLGFITSKANPYGWNLSPHLEMGTPFFIKECQTVVIEPFVMFDWANNWQYHFREHGSSGFNIALNNQYAGVFRSEIGFRFFETFQYEWGNLIIEEKCSYVNRTPTHKDSRTASFIDAATSFDIETIGNYSKNLGIAQIHIECLPACLKDIYASFDYQGQFGSSFQSHTVAFEIGKNF